MDEKTLDVRFQELVDKYGPFEAQNMQLADGLFTISDKANYDHFKLYRIKQVLSDLGYLRSAGRVLDIASLKAMFSIELALEGMNVVSVEGREKNIRRGIFCAEALGATNIEFRKDDVNNISEAEYGRFDVVLCMGILYHISQERYVDFLRNVSRCCRGVLVVDSFVALRADQSVEDKGIPYEGTTWQEFPVGSTTETREQSAHLALSNDVSFAMTKEALINFLSGEGFSTIMEVHLPKQPGQPMDRPTLICLRGEPCSLKVFPPFDYLDNFALASDTRGTSGNVAYWNAPRKAFALRRRASIAVRTVFGEDRAVRIRKLYQRYTDR